MSTRDIGLSSRTNIRVESSPTPLAPPPLKQTRATLPTAPPASVHFIQDKKLAAYDAASAAFCSFLPEFFKDKVLLLNKIRSEVATRFAIAIRNVNVCGSAQFGHSYFKQTDFQRGISDLDIAIVSPYLYARYFDVALQVTSGFSDLTKFPSPENAKQFFGLIQKKGMIRPDLGPQGVDKIAWDSFFNNISGRYKAHFSSITGAIYLSERAYITKQVDCIRAARGELQ